jgi:PAS domain S-box-containing protein
METGRISLAEAVLGTKTDAIFVADTDGIVHFWNPGAERIFGYSRDDALRQSLDIILPERLRERHWAGYREVMASGASRYASGDVLAVPAMRKDGSHVSLKFTITPFREGRMSSMAALPRGVTPLRGTA